MKNGFRWCPHCRRPHTLDTRICAATGRPLDRALHEPDQLERQTLLGAVLDERFKILRLLGAGGTGQVFEAEDTKSAQIVAVKVLAPLAGREAVLRLEREAQLIRAVQHPNICAMFFVGRSPGGPYVVFERLFGETLAAHMKKARQLSIRSAVDIFAQIASGLHAAHSANIIHRDLKPQNVFLVDRLGASPLVKLLDFGFARSLSAAAARITRPGNICGTIQYMSPEQLRGDVLDNRSDLFSVGIMLYEALAGRHPFAGTNPLDLDKKIREAALTPVRKLRRDVAPELDGIVASLLSVSPAQRPPTALHLQRALEDVLRSVPLVDESEGDEPVSVTDPAWNPPSSSSSSSSSSGA